jgi:hypothetical protein
MADPAAFQGSLVNLKNSPTHKSVVLQVEVPEEYGEAIVRAFGWPTRMKPLPVAVARLEGSGEQFKQPERRPKPRHFDELSPAEQAGILCKEEDFAEFLRTTSPYRQSALSPEETVRVFCGVESRADIKLGASSGDAWDMIVCQYRQWQDERDRLDVDF